VAEQLIYTGFLLLSQPFAVGLMGEITYTNRMKITFYGAAQNVTGSKHLIESGDAKILLDCGLHQGKRHEAYELNRTLPFRASDIDAVILSHAHADHCGMLPLLVNNGYSEKIFATPATTDIARLIMSDSARLQENDYRDLLTYGAIDSKPLPPLYSMEDVDKTCTHFESVPYSRLTAGWKQLSQSTRFKFYDAGHILGSAITVLQCDESGVSQTLVYTGDLGNTNVPILPEPEMPIESAETLIIECTYGDQNHRPMTEVSGQLKDIITDAVENKRKIIVPAFALGRTQELIYILHKLYDQGQIPALPIYLDSPLASEVTKVFSHYEKDFDQQAQIDFISRQESPFTFTNLHTVESSDDSKALMRQDGPYMVISSSGMIEGGRIVHHVEHSISDPKAIIVLTGFQAVDTLGRKIQEGQSPVRIHDTLHEIKAQVIMLGELSAHADQQGLLACIAAIKGLKNVFLVHTEITKAKVFSQLILQRWPDLNVTIPLPGESFEV